jgi:predicted porin
MKKTLWAASLSMACVGAAHAADTSVTLYGLIDAGVGYEQVKGPHGYDASKVGAVNGVTGGSRFGLKGTEDLGDGLRAIFTLENGFNPQDGQFGQGGRMFGRQATVGLAGRDWGQLEFGRQGNMAYKYFAAVDPFGLNFVVANMGTTFGAANSTRFDNMVMYQSPNWGGFKFGAGYSFNADDTSTANTNFPTADNNREFTFGAAYINGPLNVTASYDRLNPNDAAPGGQSEANLQEYILGATYDFEVVKLAAAFGQTFDGWFTGENMGTTPSGVNKFGNLALADGFKANSYMLGLTVPLGASKVFTSWQHADPKNAKLTGGDDNMNVYAVGYTYDLSKRTSLYAYASYADNFAFQDSVKDTAVAMGIRHQF